MSRLNKTIAVIGLVALAGVFSFQSIAKTATDGNRDFYSSKIVQLTKAGTSDTEDRTIEIPGAGFKAKSKDGGVQTGDWQGKTNVLIWDNAAGEVEYEVTIPESGFYNIYVEYADRNPSPEEIERGLQINGVKPYADTETFILGQHYRYDVYPFAQDAQGNELRPKPIAERQWHLTPVMDKTGMTSTPLKYQFTQGLNRMKLTGVRGSLAISKIVIKSPAPIINYSGYQAKLPSKQSPAAFEQTVEAENASGLSSQGIQLLSISEAGVSPEAYGKRKYNAIGGLSWRLPGQWLEWQLEVPENGIYQIALKYQQGDNQALSSYRTIEIDGETPFREMLNVSFAYSESWRNKVLGDDQPYGFYLAKGKHQIRLSVTSEPYQEVNKVLNTTSDAINALDIEIKTVTGVTSQRQIDMFKKYDLKKYIPDVEQRLNKLSADIRSQITVLSKITGSKETAFDMLGKQADGLEKFANHLDSIPKAIDSLSRIQADVANFSASVSFQPLLIDNLTVKSTSARFPQAKPSIWDSLSYFFKSFGASFTNDYDTKKGSKGTIEVWVARNRDYVDLMQQYANEYFTPRTGYKVNINYIPNTNILVLANAAGKQPDVVSGVGMDTPFNFALRKAVVPLNDYPGYADLIRPIAPGTLIPFQYNGKHYALPEEATMSLMYYREDVLQKYNIPVPQTWEDMKKILPSLQQRNMNAWVPQGDFLTFFYQNGVDIYTPDGNAVAYGTPKGFATFKYMTDLYVKYNLPLVISSFYQHFRQGDIPIGISGMTDYLLFRLAAPEISSLWKIAPMPGTVDGNGQNVRWHGGDVRGVMMVKTTKERQDKAWEFIRWWMSTDTQAQFANDLENYYGIEFRWYSANTDVVRRTPWTPDDKKVVLQQLQWFKGVPYVPGGSYMTGRELANAWIATVIYKLNYREQMENAIDAITREIQRYRREYGVAEGSP